MTLSFARGVATVTSQSRLRIGGFWDRTPYRGKAWSMGDFSVEDMLRAPLPQESQDTCKTEALPTPEERRRKAAHAAQAWQDRASNAKMKRTPSWQTLEEQLVADSAPPATKTLPGLLAEIITPQYWWSVAQSVYQYMGSTHVPRFLNPVLQAMGIRVATSRAERLVQWRISDKNSSAFRAAVRERQRRRHLGNALSTLKSAIVPPDAVVAHQKSFEDEIATIIARGEEHSSFFAVNVSTIITRWSELRHSATNIHAELRVNITGDAVLIALMAMLRMAMRVETIQDVDILARIAEKYPMGDSFSHTPTGTTPFVWDSCPVRPSAHLAATLRAGIRAFLIDSVDEAVRILHAHKRLQITGPVSFVVLVRSPGSQPKSSSTDLYGSRLTKVERLAARLKKVQANVIGVTTVVRDQTNLESVVPTLENAIEHLRAHGHDIQFVSLQGLDQGSVEDSWIATNLKVQDENIQMLRARFHIPRVYCDASRYLLADSHVLLARVIGEKPSYDAEGTMIGHQYYIDDGCYGSFGRMQVTADRNDSDSAHHPFTVQVTSSPVELGEDGTGSVATIWGQTCDSIDCVAQQVVLPQLGLGSWLSFTGLDQTGTTYSTQFNGFPAPSKKYFIKIGSTQT